MVVKKDMDIYAKTGILQKLDWMQIKVTKMLQHFQIVMSVLPKLVALFL